MEDGGAAPPEAPQPGVVVAEPTGPSTASNDPVAPAATTSNDPAGSGDDPMAMEVEQDDAGMQQDPSAVFSALDSLGPPQGSPPQGSPKLDAAFEAMGMTMGMPVQQDYARRAMHPMKVSFYELIIRQLADDEFLDEALSLKNRSGLKEAGHVESNWLFRLYEENFGKHFSDQNKWTDMGLTPMPKLESGERCLDVEEPRFDLDGLDKITYTDSYKNVIADDDPESIAKGEGKGQRDGKDRDGKDAKDHQQEPPVAKARPLHRKKANIFNKVHYNTAHKQMVRAVAFSPDGRFAASGSHDTTVKVLDVNKMFHYGSQNAGERRDQGSDVRPVMRTLYDHQGPVNSLCFHPHLAYLFTASADKTVKVFDLTRPQTQLKSLSSIPDSSMVQTMAVHPSGDYLYVGTAHPTIRLYDLTRLECFTGPNPNDYHTGMINDLAVTSDGKVLASASSDGEVKLWDVVANRVVNSMSKAHHGASVCSVKWSRNLRYFLTAGCDGKAKLWDARKGGNEPVHNMNVCAARNLEYARAAFIGQERFIAVASSGNDLCILDAQTGEYLQGAVARGGYHHHTSHHQHSNPVFCIAAHPNDTKFLTGSDDHKVRYCEILNRPEDWVNYRDRQRERHAHKGHGHGANAQPILSGPNSAPVMPPPTEWWQHTANTGENMVADGTNYPDVVNQPGGEGMGSGNEEHMDGDVGVDPDAAPVLGEGDVEY
ncbi:unnamed protein product [Amoebophrya sp. A120]|nr:unnamed protein product [Amoebophrya sp. A120]|eukprot:GSA120T00012716001.1